MKVFIAVFFACCCAITLTAGEPDGSDDPDSEAVTYECHSKLGKGISARKPLKILKNMKTFRQCKNACTEKKKKHKRIDGVTYSKASGCKCIFDMQRIDMGKENRKYRSCHLKRDEPNEMNGIDNHPVSLAQAVDLTYPFFKDVHCDTTWTKVGCFNVTHRDRFLLSYRSNIEWEQARFPAFATSLVCACAEAARLNDVQYFATHFWGECWEIDVEDFAKTGTEGCMLADGLHYNKCGGVNEGGECVGTTAYYIYTNIGTATEGDKKKKKEVQEVGIPILNEVFATNPELNYH